jgi:hypothetical protein
MNTHVATAIATAALTLLGTIASADVTGHAYDQLLIDEVEISYDAASPLQALSPPEARRIRDAARAALTSAAGERFTIVTEPGPGVIRLHASVAIDAAKKDKHFWRFTPVGFVKTRVDVASGADLVLRAATIDLAVLDALSGERVPVPRDSQARDATAQSNSPASLRDVAAALEAKARTALDLVAAP